MLVHPWINDDNFTENDDDWNDGDGFNDYDDDNYLNICICYCQIAYYIRII